MSENISSKMWEDKYKELKIQFEEGKTKSRKDILLIQRIIINKVQEIIDNIDNIVDKEKDE